MISRKAQGSKKAMGKETSYVVGSGSGYFLHFIGDTPEMTSDPLCATRMSKDEVEDVMFKLDIMGFEAHLVTIRKGLYFDQPAEVKMNPLKRFFCWLGWHSFTSGFESTGFDGASEHARCKWCGFDGMIDSQGNLF